MTGPTQPYNNGHKLQDVLRVITSMYDLMGPTTYPPVNQLEITRHADDIFEVCNYDFVCDPLCRNTVQKLDANNDGRIDWNEFYAGCRRDPTISQSLCIYAYQLNRGNKLETHLWVS